MKDFIAALAKAQTEIKNAPLNKTNPHFRSKYADLAAIRDAITPALSKNNIAVVQTVESSGERYSVKTSLMHGDNTIDSICPIMCGPNDPAQKFGSAMTYARRYSLAAIVGIAAEEDDDGQAASDQKQGKAHPAKQAEKPAPDFAPDPFETPDTMRDDVIKLLGTCRNQESGQKAWQSQKAKLLWIKKNAPDHFQALQDYLDELKSTVWADDQNNSAQ